MLEDRNEIVINATREAIWRVLIDIEHYTEWNPLLCEGKGTVALNNQIEVTAKSASKEMVLQCQVITFDPLSEVAWEFHIIAPFLFRAVHRFTLETLPDNQVRLIDREQFRGWMVPLHAKEIKTDSRDGMAAMDKALKEWVEVSV